MPNPTFINGGVGIISPVYDHVNSTKQTLAGSSVTPAIPAGTKLVLLYNADGSNTYWLRTDGVAAAATTAGNLPLGAGREREIAIPEGGGLRVIGTGVLYCYPVLIT